jgi:hypothetical protein
MDRAGERAEGPPKAPPHLNRPRGLPGQVVCAKSVTIFKCQAPCQPLSQALRQTMIGTVPPSALHAAPVT